jgi:Bacterial membrane protein YfhO
VFLDRLPLRFDVRAALFDGREAFLASLYLGLAASGLVAAAVLEGRRLPRALLLVAAAALVLALGRHTPVYHLLTAAVPPLRALRFPAKAMILVGFAWALLAGMGADALGRLRGWRQAAVRGWLLVAAVTAAAGVLILRFQGASYAPAVIAEEFRRRSLDVVVEPAWHNLLVAAVAAAIVAALAGRATARSTAGFLALALAVAGDLGFAHRALHGTADAELLRFRPEALRFLADRPPLGRVYSYDYLDPRGQLYLGHPSYLLKLVPDEWPVVWADAAALRTALFPSVLGYWGVETAYANDALGLYSEPLAVLTSLLRVQEQSPLELRLLQMGAVSRVVALHAQGFEDLRPVGQMDGLFLEPIRVFAVPDPLPRVYAVEGARVADKADAVAALTDPRFDPRREVVLAEGTAATPRDGFTSSVRVVEWKPDRLAVDVELDRPGHLVLVDTYDPGWKATLDGAPAVLERANLALRAVAVPAGAHRVAMAYRPASIRIGLAVSGLSLVAAGLLLAVRPRAQR